jgi:hypothetical protein
MPDASGKTRPASSPVPNAPTSELPAAHAGAKASARRQGSATTPNPVLRMARSVPLGCFQTTRIPSLFQCESGSYKDVLRLHGLEMRLARDIVRGPATPQDRG